MATTKQKQFHLNPKKALEESNDQNDCEHGSRCPDRKGLEFHGGFEEDDPRPVGN